MHDIKASSSQIPIASVYVSKIILARMKWYHCFSLLLCFLLFSYEINLLKFFNEFEVCYCTMPLGISLLGDKLVQSSARLCFVSVPETCT